MGYSDRAVLQHATEIRQLNSATRVHSQPIWQAERGVSALVRDVSIEKVAHTLSGKSWLRPEIPNKP